MTIVCYHDVTSPESDAFDLRYSWMIPILNPFSTQHTSLSSQIPYLTFTNTVHVASKVTKQTTMKNRLSELETQTENDFP
jgi:hypothetical protein